DLADALRLGEAERNPKLQLADTALPESKCASNALRVSDRARRRPFRVPLGVGLDVEFDDRLTRLVDRPPLPPRQPPFWILTREFVQGISHRDHCWARTDGYAGNGLICC